MLNKTTQQRIDAVAKATSDLVCATAKLRRAERALAKDEAADPDQSVENTLARLSLLNDLTIGYVVAGRCTDPPAIPPGQAARIVFKIGPVSESR